MAVPDITTLRSDAAELIQKCAEGQNEAIITGALAAFNIGAPLSPAASAQDLITECQPLIDQANRDVISIRTREWLKFFTIVGTSSGGVPGAPDAPFLNGSIDVADLVDLDWTNVSNETGYAVYRSTDNSVYTLLTTTAQDVVTFGETFDNSSGLFYKVLAFNASGNSAFSNVVNLSPPPATYTFYYGKSALTVLNEAQILALSTRVATSPSASYVFIAGAAYVYFAFPITASAPSFMRVAGFDLDLAGAAEGYNDTTNGLTHTLVTVGGVSHRLYRSLNTLGGAFTVVVT